MFCYESRRDLQKELWICLKKLVLSRLRFGYRRLMILPQPEGWIVNAKRGYRLYRAEIFDLRVKLRRKRVAQIQVPVPATRHSDDCWNLDFMVDQLSDGRRYR